MLMGWSLEALPDTRVAETSPERLGAPNMDSRPLTAALALPPILDPSLLLTPGPSLPPPSHQTPDKNKRPITELLVSSHISLSK